MLPVATRILRSNTAYHGDSPFIFGLTAPDYPLPCIYATLNREERSRRLTPVVLVYAVDTCFDHDRYDVCQITNLQPQIRHSDKRSRVSRVYMKAQLSRRSWPSSKTQAGGGAHTLT